MDCKYSYQWALSVVEEFIRSHARASEVVFKISKISSRECAYLLANRMFSRWDHVKCTIKLVERLMDAESCGNGPKDGPIGPWLKANVVALMQKWALRPQLLNKCIVDKAVEVCENRGAVHKGGFRSEATSDGTQLLLDLGD